MMAMMCEVQLNIIKAIKSIRRIKVQTVIKAIKNIKRIKVQTVIKAIKIIKRIKVQTEEGSDRRRFRQRKVQTIENN